MSTRSAILIKVRKEDIGKVMKFNKNKLPKGVTLQKWDCYNPKEIGIEHSKRVMITKPYLGIYCHSDGYLDGVGMSLKQDFTDYNAVLNLIIGGSCSVVLFGSVRHYANRNCEEWDYIKPIQGDTPSEVASFIDHNGYVYLFEDGKWSVKSENEFKDYNEEGVIE